MSHSIALPNSGDFIYSDFKLLDKLSDSNDICRITRNKNGEEYLSSAYSLKERFIQFISYIPLLSRMDFVSKQLDLIKADQAEAVSVFLRVLRDEFGSNSFCSENRCHEKRPDFLKCKDISIWLNDAANSTIHQRECTDVNNENLANLKSGLISKFSALSSESLDSFVENKISNNHVDIIVNKINVILQKTKIPEHLHVNLRASILEHLNLNALDSEHALKSISDFICDFMNVSHMTNNKVPLCGKPFKLPDDVLRILERIQTKTDFTSTGILLAGVAELKAEIKSAGQIKDEIRSSLHAYTMINAYMHSLVAPALPMSLEYEYISAHSLASQTLSVPAARRAPSMPTVSQVSLAPPPPPMPSTLWLSSAPTSQPQLSSRTSQSEKSKGGIEKKTMTHAAQAGGITGVMNDESFFKKLQQRRNALEGRPQNENSREDSTTERVKAVSHHHDDTGMLAIMQRGFEKTYPSQVPFDSGASDDSGLNTHSNRSSVSGDSAWSE
ncbi:hypothetical protein [Candidatus Symbiopectobacterium sp. NZEC135]|uniref:hypothetical protein n=1 Tax=Candidatus Symbiopectobacterium sp. NZEC135 TaxID=2820471 RepID=UPI0022261578|nr:hypothetical protein [Candidatus Symbiopectobacterium sp. NZEC135]MCW2480812.1 hypothetical protein [Candidatus Symbiopectobacterium sp. NZEC135]